jgi:RND family efflux transporter MFP subunit
MSHRNTKTEKEMKTIVLWKHDLVLWTTIGLIATTLLVSTGCSNATSSAKPPDPTEVEVVAVEQRDVPIYAEWIGTLDGMVNAVIRAQVTGYLLRQNYLEGSLVRKGQLLFEIDPRPFQAAVDQAQGQLAQANGQLAQAKAQLATAEANQGRTQLDVDRYVPLAKQQAITQQDLDNATQNNLSSKAQVETAKAQIEASSAAIEAAKATRETARVNLGFTRLTSPIDGIAGVAQGQVGNLVSLATNAVTTVSTVDPIKVNFTVSEQEYLNFARRDTAMNRLELELILADGTTYPRKGKFAFADRQVDQSTGAIQLTGLFPNPGNILRPGQYGRVRTVTGIRKKALLVPQRAVTELQGSYQVAVVGSGNKVSIRSVKVGERSGSVWVIEDGVKPGEKVVAEGLQRVRPDVVVNPKPFVAPSPKPTQ